MGRAGNSRLVGVDLLRAFAVLLVLCFHWRSSGLGRDADWHALEPVARRLVLLAFNEGYKGVIIFFALSGFLITRTIMAREPDLFSMSWARFYARRAARIQPMLAVSILLGMLALLLVDPTFAQSRIFLGSGLPFDTSFWMSLPTFSFNWLRIASGHAQDAWGMHWDVLWSLAVEEQFYLVLPWVVLLSGPRRLVPVLLATVAASGLSRPPFFNPAPVWQFATSWNAGALAIGVLFALLVPRLKPEHAARLAISGLGFLALGFLLPAVTPGEDLLAIGAACCASACVCSTRVGPRLLNFPAAIGQASYEIYLLHPAVLFAAAPILQGWSLAGGGFLFAGMTAALGCAVHRGFSEPANLWLRAKLTPRPASYAVTS